MSIRITIAVSKSLAYKWHVICPNLSPIFLVQVKVLNNRSIGICYWHLFNIWMLWSGSNLGWCKAIFVCSDRCIGIGLGARVASIAGYRKLKFTRDTLIFIPAISEGMWLSVCHNNNNNPHFCNPITCQIKHLLCNSDGFVIQWSSYLRGCFLHFSSSPAAKFQ